MPDSTNLTAAQKLSIVREHLIENIPVPTLCEKYQVSPDDFDIWLRQLFENGEQCFQRKKNSANERRQGAASDRKIKQLEAKLQQKDEVIAELRHESSQLKKNFARGQNITGVPWIW